MQCHRGFPWLFLDGKIYFCGVALIIFCCSQSKYCRYFSQRAKNATKLLLIRCVLQFFYILLTIFNCIILGTAKRELLSQRLEMRPLSAPGTKVQRYTMQQIFSKQKATTTRQQSFSQQVESYSHEAIEFQQVKSYSQEAIEFQQVESYSHEAMEFQLQKVTTTK